MRDELLFIDGELVDLDDNTKITLKYSSNIFTDLNKIVSNNSYTIKLPDTVRNQRVIEHADLPSCDTDYQRRVHEARYFRNGIEIISKAQAVLMSVSETFDMAMVWGNKTSFASVINDGKKLIDLNSGTVEGEDYAVWKNWGAFSERFPNINYGFNSGEASTWYHPVVTAKWIIDKIMKDNGIFFDITPDKLSSLNKMIVPLFSKNDSSQLYDAYPMILNAIGYDSSIIKFESIGDSSQQYVLSTSADRSIYPKFDSTLKLKGKIELLYTYYQGIDYLNTPLNITISSTPHKQEEIININKPAGYVEPPYIRLVYNIDALAKVYKDGYFIISSGNGKQLMHKVSGSLSVTISEREGGVLLGEKFPFAPNLPDIKQIDFIKAVSQMMGVFAIPVGDDTIKFVSVDDIIANKPKAVNWTKKVIASSNENKPKSMNYILDGFARNNRFKWKEDNTVIGNYDGNIVVNDSTIEYERDAVTLPFAASDTKGEVAYIPIYSYKEDGSLDYSSKNVKPRLLYLDGVKGVFTGLSWDKLIAENYSNYIKIVSNPRIITEKIEINDIELKNLDVTVPAYLGQYGRYYAIISVKAEDTGICECKLLQLEV